MESLYNKFHKIDDNERKNIYLKRFNYESTIKLNFKIKPFNFNDSFELYYIPTYNDIKLIEKIYKNDKILNTLHSNLPGIADEKFKEELLIDELFKTNDIEGVRSSRKELRENIELIEKNIVNKTIRFESLINSYKKLQTSELSLPTTSQDIRKIYDYIAAEEVSENNKIDGSVFRLDQGEVSKGSGSGKIIHKGIFGESNIIEAISKLLNFINNNGDIPELIKLSIFHYYFGYIHPFYDGNGRTCRFITSLYLKKDLSLLTSLSLSSGIMENQKNYLSAFEKTNSFKNFGELNEFVTMFLTSISLGQEKLITELTEKINLLTTAQSKITTGNYDIDTKSILFIFAQQFLFSHNKHIELSKLENIAYDLSKNKIRKIITDLENKNILIKTKKRPLSYTVADDYFETII